jgi:hypothetical protein
LPLTSGKASWEFKKKKRQNAMFIHLFSSNHSSLSSGPAPSTLFKKKKKKDTKKMKQGWRCVSSDSLRLPCKRKALNSNPSTTTKKYIYKPVEVW